MGQDSEQTDDGGLLDLLFIQDATASMDEYIDSAKNSIVEICSILHASGRLQREEGLQVGILAYRDYPEEGNGFVVKPHAFTYDLSVMEGYLTHLEAAGGGDLPEAFSTALEYAFVEMKGWRDEALKAVVVVTDAAPHGINEKFDSVPDGAPTGMTVRDPIKLAKAMADQGYSIFILACEPILGNTTEYAIDFYKALSTLSLGTFCSLTDHKLLAACIIGSLLERIDLRKLSIECQADVARRLFKDNLSIDAVVDELHEKLTFDGQQVTTLQTASVYNDLPAARHNFNAFMSSVTLADAKKLLKRVYARRNNATCIQKTKAAYAEEGGSFSLVPVRFRNLGSHRIVLQLFDAELCSMCADIILPDSFTMVKKFKINVPVNFVLQCGPRTKNFSRSFSKEQDIDVDQVFNYS